MHLRIRSLAAMTVAATLGSLSSGCGVTLEATHMSATEATKGEGVVYALPRTALAIAQPVNLVLSGGGEFGNWETCAKVCSAQAPDDVIKDSCRFDIKPKITFGGPDVIGTSEADPAHVYRVAISPGWFETVNHKFVVGADGVLTATENSASNMGYEIASEVLKMVAQGAKTVLGAPRGSQTAAEQLAARTTIIEMAKVTAKPRLAQCFDLQARLKVLYKKLQDEVDCPTVKLISACLADTEKEVEAMKAAHSAAVKDAYTKGKDADTLKFVDDRGKALVAEAEAKSASARALYGISPGTTTKIAYVVTTPLLTPQDVAILLPDGQQFTPDTATIVLARDINDGKAIVTSTHEAADKGRPFLVESLSGYTIKADIKSKDGGRSGRCLAPIFSNRVDCREPDTGGYRYRLPAQGEVTLILADSTSKAVYKAVREIPIAQYGLIATMPSHFRGKGGKVNVKLHPATGALQEAEIGGDALPTTAVTDVVDKVKERVEARRSVDPELATLKREAEIADLKKKIRDANEPAAAKAQ
jgi:hypothetical protein